MMARTCGTLMTDPRIEQVREALDWIPSGFTDCNGDKCRQMNCSACYSEPVPAPGPVKALAALSSLKAELRTCSRDWQEIHDALDGKPAPGATRLLESAARIDNLRVSLAVAEAELETMRRRVDAGNKLEDIARESHKKYDDLATAVEALVEKWRAMGEVGNGGWVPRGAIASWYAAYELEAALSGSTPEDTDG